MISLILVLVILVLIPSDISTQSSNNFCTRVNKNQKCNGKFSFDCFLLKCSVDKANCDQFLKLGFSFNSFFTSLSAQQNKLKKYQKLKKEIKRCSEFQYEWQPENVCLRKMNCFSFTFYSVYHKLRECKCSGKHSHLCGQKFCSLDKEECEYFEKKIVPHKSKLNQIKKCLL